MCLFSVSGNGQFLHVYKAKKKEDRELSLSSFMRGENLVQLALHYMKSSYKTQYSKKV